jgi:hypothetical protein
MAVPPNPYFIPYTYHENVLALCIVMPVVCIFMVAARMYVRRFQKGGLGVDDWLALSTLVNTRSSLSSSGSILVNAKFYS